MESTKLGEKAAATRALSFEDRIFEPRYVASWIGFTLSAGIVNAGAVLACDTVVTHVTGNVTQVALDKELGFALLFIVASFIGGAMLAALVRETLGSRPRVAFAAPIAASAAVLLAISFVGSLGLFGAFGESRVSSRTFLLLAVLAGAMGMLNASVAGVTGNQVRTTHFSGPATDLAGNVVRGLLGTGKGHGAELRWAALRASMLATFGGGAFVAAELGHRLQFGLFAVAAGTLLTSLLLTLAPERAFARAAARLSDVSAAPSGAPSSFRRPQQDR
ncbi:MAG: putative transrane protein [Labilithrix sp.]|nr:putative transrane protein [Labilithrix sp.]